MIKKADLFLKLLHDFSSLGSAMRTVMTKCLIDPQTYQRLTNVDSDSEYANFMIESKEKYEDALRSLPNLEPPTEFQGKNYSFDFKLPPCGQKKLSFLNMSKKLF